MELERMQIPIGTPDFSALTTEEDFCTEAQRLLPDFLNRLGEAMGEVLWDKTQASLKSVRGMKLNTSSSDKQRFVREAGQNYRRGLSGSDKQKIETYIVQKLKEGKEQRGGDVG